MTGSEFTEARRPKLGGQKGWTIYESITDEFVSGSKSLTSGILGRC